MPALFPSDQQETEPLTQFSGTQARDAVFNACAVIGFPTQTRLIPPDMLSVDEFEKDKKTLVRTAGFINSNMTMRVSRVKGESGDARPRTRVLISIDAKENNVAKKKFGSRIESMSTLIETDARGIDRIREVKVEFVDPKVKEAGTVVYRPYATTESDRIQFIPAPGTEKALSQAGTLMDMTLRQQITAATIGRGEYSSGVLTKKVISAVILETPSLPNNTSYDDLRAALSIPDVVRPNLDLEAGTKLIKESVLGQLVEIVRNERLNHITALMGVYRDRTNTPTAESEAALQRLAIEMVNKADDERREKNLLVGEDYYRVPFATTVEDAQKTVENIAGALEAFGLLKHAGDFIKWEMTQFLHPTQTLISNADVGKCNITVGGCVKPRNTTDTVTVIGCTAPIDSDVAVHAVYWLEYANETGVRSTAAKIQHLNEKGEVTAECIVSMVGGQSVIKFSRRVRKEVERPYKLPVIREVMEDCPAGELDPDIGRVMIDYAVAMVDDRKQSDIAHALKLRMDETFYETELDIIERVKREIEARILAELTPEDQIVASNDDSADVMDVRLFGEKDVREDVTVRTLDQYKPESIARVKKTISQEGIFEEAQRQAQYAQACKAKLAVAAEGKSNFEQLRRIAASAVTGMRDLVG